MSHGIPDPVIVAAFLMLIAALGGALYRLVRGPTLADRVVAVDIVTVVSVGLVTVHAIASDTFVYVDTAVVIALITFIATVGFAHYVENRAGENPDVWRREP